MIFATIMTDPRERTRFLRFAAVGFIGAVVDFGTFNLLSAGLGLSVVVSSVFSFIAAIISNFTWNRYWTYPDSRTKAISHQLLQFTVVSVVGLAIRTPIIALMEKPFGRLFARLAFLPAGPLTAQFFGNNFALAAGVIVVMFWNFFVNRYWTYGDVDRPR
jgi:putative flippase GtrA